MQLALEVKESASVSRPRTVRVADPDTVIGWIRFRLSVLKTEGLREAAKKFFFFVALFFYLSLKIAGNGS